MKRIAWIVLIAPLFLQFQHSRGNFGGRWELDLKKSSNLPPSFATVDSYVIDIRQSGDSLTVLAEMKGSGQTVPFPPFIYVVDGKETYRRDSLRGSDRWSSARWTAGGSGVAMDSRVSLKAAGRPPMEFTQHDEWKLGAGGSTLDISITQKMKGSDSVRTEHRVFRKQR